MQGLGSKSYIQEQVKGEGHKLPMAGQLPVPSWKVSCTVSTTVRVKKLGSGPQTLDPQDPCIWICGSVPPFGSTPELTILLLIRARLRAQITCHNSHLDACAIDNAH